MHFADLCGHEQRPDGVLDVTAEVVGDMLQSEILRRVDSRLDREDGQQVVEPISHPARTTDRC